MQRGLSLEGVYITPSAIRSTTSGCSLVIPVTLFATLARGGPLELSVPEAADVVLCFSEGLTAQVHLDFWSRPPMHRMDLICSEGSIHWDYMTGSLQVWHTNREGCKVDAFPSVDARNELFLSEARHFLGMLSGSEESRCTLDDGIAVVRICEAIDRSAASGELTPMDRIPPPNSSSTRAQDNETDERYELGSATWNGQAGSSDTTQARDQDGEPCPVLRTPLETSAPSGISDRGLQEMVSKDG